MEANEHQVGGSHYKTKPGVPQHWDLCIMYGWDAFQYQITKYVFRWKDKNGLEDLKKARHFLDKYIEEVEKGSDFPKLTPSPVVGVDLADPNTPSQAVILHVESDGQGGWRFPSWEQLADTCIKSGKGQFHMIRPGYVELNICSHCCGVGGYNITEQDGHGFGHIVWTTCPDCEGKGRIENA